jgi:hypothetical protein
MQPYFLFFKKKSLIKKSIPSKAKNLQKLFRATIGFFMKIDYRKAREAFMGFRTPSLKR